MKVNSVTTVEVVVCTYNGQRFIDEQLNSIRRQSRPVDLISVRDDGSSDDTVRHLERHACADVRVRVVCNPINLGYSQNFGQGLLQATGDIVFLSDQDDLWEHDKVARMLATFEDPSVALAFSDGALVDAKSQPIAGATVLRGYGLDPLQLAAFRQNPMRHLLRRNYVNGAAMAVRRAAVPGAMPIPRSFPHDYWLALWLARIDGITCVDSPLYRYRQHDCNLIGAGRTSRLQALRSMSRNPSAPRRLDLQRTRSLLERLPADDVWRPEIQRKHDWLVSVVEERSRLKRMLNIGRAVLRKDYAHFGVPAALQRDLLACLR